MLDPRLLRKERDKLEELLRRKDPTLSLDELCRLDEEMRDLKTQLEQLQARRNDYSKKIGDVVRGGGDASPLKAEVAAISDEVHRLEPRLAELEHRFTTTLAALPNIPEESIPVSQEPRDNVVLKQWGAKPSFDFPYKNHVELNKRLDLFDFKRGAKVSGAGWPIYKGWGARLEWALIQFMLNRQIANGFTPWLLPALVRQDIVYGSGQLPKFEHQQFKIRDDDYNLYLVPTAEVPLSGLHHDEILDEETLPLRYTAYTPCFRREAGAAGASERGLIRMHQFNKVELFSFCRPDESGAVFDAMVACAEGVLEALNIHYRSMLLVTGDMSFAAARTVDIEVWLPGQDRYYEVSSVSNCTDFQSRRGQTRYRPRDGGKPEYVHTLNGSGLATSRLMVALLENNQRADGSVVIPAALRPYLDGKELLVPSS